MKKFLAIISIVLLSACAEEAVKTESSKPVASDSSCKIKAVKDKDLGHVYYAPSHRLYKYVTNVDHRYCTEDEAKKAGFTDAPKLFSNSTAEYIECLDGENGSGTCHNYVSGIYQSLKIYDKVCGPDNISKEELATTVREYAKKDESRLDADKYSSIASAMIDKYSCKSTADTKKSSKAKSDAKKQK